MEMMVKDYEREREKVKPRGAMESDLCLTK